MFSSFHNTILYHYTDFVALDSILRCAELRLNNILNMNDASEMRLFMNGLCRAVCQRLEDQGHAESAQGVKRLFAQELKKEFAYSAYAACFSLWRDDAAQWERYGHGGRGVCIAFYGDVLEKLTGGVLSLQTVFYQEDMSGHELVEVFLRLCQARENLTAADPDVQSALNEAWVASAAFKHPSFSCENEVRLVVSPFDREYFSEQPRYHVSPERIKKYYPLNLRRMCSRNGLRTEELISEIIVGPESGQSLPIFQDYLRDRGLCDLAQRVSLSDCPLRHGAP